MKRLLLPLSLVLLLAACMQQEVKAPTREEHIEMIKGEAIKDILKEAQGGDADAMFVLGNIYYHGEKERQDLEMAMEWFLKAAAQNHAEAQYALGVIYYKGQGVERDPLRAAGWLRKAAEQGVPRAQILLADIYYTGDGGMKDLTEAKGWYQKAADQGHPEAQYRLGRMFEAGDGVTKSPSAAAYWYYQAGLYWVAQGRRDEALANMDAIKRCDPTSEYLSKLDDAIRAKPTVVPPPQL